MSGRGLYAAIILEPMQLDDVDAVLLIEHQSFSTPWSRQLFESELASDSSRLLVARLDVSPHTLVGYIGYRVVVDEMHIVIVAVDPAWRRHGIARDMLCQALGQARLDACVRATLEVRASNIAAQQLYYRQGFAPVGTRPRYYHRPPEDALILWRDSL